MNSMKAAIYSGKAAEAPEVKPKKVVKDGSAHPHPGSGSDARVGRNFDFIIKLRFYRVYFIL